MQHGVLQVKHVTLRGQGDNTRAAHRMAHRVARP
jgi:hypothetical protein